MNEKENLELKEEIFNDLIEYNSRINENLENIRSGIITIKSAIITISNVLANAKKGLDYYINSNDYANDYLCNRITNINIEIEKLKDKENK